MHRLLTRQLKKAGIISDNENPDSRQLQQLLELVSQTYQESDKDRYTIERSLSISSKEMQELYHELKAKSESQLVRDRAMLRSLVDSIPDLIFFKDKDSRYLGCNLAYGEFVGCSEEELVGKTDFDLFDEDKAEKIRCQDQTIMQEGEVCRSEEWITYPDKRMCLIDGIRSPFHGRDGELLGLIGIGRDITDRKQAEEQLHVLTHTVEQSASVVLIVDVKNRIKYVNPRFTELTGYLPDEVIGKSSQYLQSRETLIEHGKEMQYALNSGREWRGEVCNRKKNGDRYWAYIVISPIKDDKGEITYYICSVEDITETHQLNEQLSYEASHDSLTGLVNRREFEARVQSLLDRNSSRTEHHAMCFMDLDQFKVVNDTCGHSAGDELLRQVSRHLIRQVRSNDTLARLGGDEFGVLIEHCSLENAIKVAENLQQAITEFQFQWENRLFKIGVSIGLVAIANEDKNLTKLFRNADAACYMAKDLGRNRIHIYTSEDRDLAQRHGEMEWVTRIYRALEKSQLQLYAQTINPISNSLEKKLHYELLLRMQDDDGNIIPPGSFLPAAERYNLIAMLDRWVINYSFAMLVQYPLFMSNIGLCSINLSGQSLTESGFLDFIINKFDETGMQPEKICFEITETAAIANLSMASNFINTLRNIGCSFALDDFGSGLSSFGYLKNLPVDYLKIDGMFVRDILNDPIDRAMVKSINEIGQVMGMETIAEFVENDEIIGMLREIGVDYVQGYAFGRPVPLSDILS